MSMFATVKHIAALYRPYRKWVLLGILCTLGDCLFQTFINSLPKYLLDEVKWELDHTGALYAPFLKAALVTLGLLAVVRCLFLYLKRRLLITLSRYVEFDLRTRLFDKLLSLSPAFYHRNKIGDLMSRATADTEAVRMLAGPALLHVSYTVFIFLFFLPAMFMIDATLTLAALLPMAGLMLSLVWLFRLWFQKSKEVQERLADISVAAQENFSGIRVIRTFTQEQNEQAKFNEKCAAYRKAYLGYEISEGIFSLAVTSFTGLLVVVILFVGGRRVIAGDMSLGSLLSFMLYQTNLVWPLMAVGWTIGLFQRGVASMERIREILDEHPEVTDLRAPAAMERMAGRIEIRDLSFQYGTHAAPALSHVSFTVEPGQHVAVIGRTGSGKTTLAALLQRMYPVPYGRIFIDGVDINEIPLDVLRRRVSCVPQDAFLFSTTIAENIGYGLAETAPEPVLRRFADAAQFDDEVREFPEGYQQILGERGVTLSGGQKQRATIARALITRPAVLILDDALSAVDTHTEEKILQKLAAETKGVTRITIAHRISTVKHADLILVMDNGRIIERGTHDSLAASGGLYAKLHRLQLLSDEIETM